MGCQQEYIFVAQRPNSGLGHLFFCGFEIIRNRTHTQAGLLWTSDQLVAEAATYTSHNISKRRTSVPSAGLEPAIPFTTAINAKWSLGVPSPLCILELSRPVRIDMAVKNTTILCNIQGVSVHKRLSQLPSHTDHYQQTMQEPRAPSGPSQAYQ